jgi:hypothetical protein
MIDALRLAAAWALVALVGVAIVLLLEGPRRPASTSERHVHPAWTLGAGTLAGMFVLTVWMRVLSFAGLRFGVAAIALPLALAAVGVALWLVSSRRAAPWRIPSTDAGAMPRVIRAFWWALLAWLVARFALLLLDVVWTPLYPWDAWIQWATKARVWYGLGHMVPFAGTEAWFAANGSVWHDASPNYPATVPLWQVWSSIALGRFDDALMNVPWWIVAVALAFAVYGAVRDAGVPPIGAMVGAWLASSLPLANTHVALAGYADFPMAAYYAVAAIAVWRWTRSRAASDLALAALLAIACITIKTPGVVWALTLVPALVVVLAGRLAPRVLGAGALVIAFALLVLAQTHPVVLGYRLHLDFAPPWQGLVDSLFLLGNWNLLWYALVATAIVGWRAMRAPALAPLSAIVAAGFAFLAIVFAFTNARDWVAGQTTINRALLHIAPLAIVWMVVVVDAWRRRLAERPATLVPA